MHNTKLRILTRNEVHQLRPPDYLVPRILPREGFVYLVAPPSSKKTFVAIELAACVATGQPFFGKPVQSGNVVYMAAEGQAGIKKRLDAWEKARGILIADKTFSVIPTAVALNNPTALKNMAMDLEAHAEKIGGIDLIVIDTVNRTLEGDENSARDMTVYVQACSQIIKNFNTAMLMLHHPAKTGNSGARGHSALNGAADIGLEIKSGQQDKFTLKFDAKPPKDDEATAPLNLKIRVVDLSDTLGFDGEGQPVTSLVLDQADGPFSPDVNIPKRVSDISRVSEMIFSSLNDGHLRRGEIVSNVLKQGFTGNPRTIDRALASLAKDEVIRQPEHGCYELVAP